MRSFFCKLVFSCVFLLFSVVICSEFDQDPSSENIGTYFSAHYNNEMKRTIALASGKDIVVFFGKTGAGKSTLINYLTEKPLRRIEGGALEIIGPVAQALSIGHGDNSCTSVPSCMSYQNLLYYDFPGFNDTRGSINDVFNAFVMKSIIEKAKTVRIVLVASWSEIDAERGTEFAKYMDEISSLIPRRTIEEISCLVITKVKQDDFEDLAEFIRSGLARKAPEATAPWRNEKVQMMYSPTSADRESYNQPDQRMIINGLIRATRPEKIGVVDIVHVFSERTRDQIKEVFKEEVIRIAQKIIERCPNVGSLSVEKIREQLHFYELLTLHVSQDFRSLRSLSDIAKFLKKIAEREYDEVLVNIDNLVMAKKYEIVNNIQACIDKKNSEEMSVLKREVGQLSGELDKGKKDIRKLREEVDEEAEKRRKAKKHARKLEEKVEEQQEKIQELERKQQIETNPT